MRSSHFRLSEDNLYVYKWEPYEADRSVGIIQLVHGSCEHGGRYEDFARYLTEQGYIVYASDLRGHGKSAANSADLGYFGERDGWNKMVADLGLVTRRAGEEHPGLKIIMLGHSMGSFLARHYATLFGSEIDGLILVGTAHQSRFLLKMAKLLALIEIRVFGIRHRSTFLTRLSYDTFNNRIVPARTKQDWLTRDEAVVDRFIEDNCCGFVLTAGGFRDMFNGLLYITDPVNIRRTRKDLPIFLLSGQEDPVGSYGKMVRRAYDRYRTAGVSDLQVKLYKEMRHELLNERGREQVYCDILEWVTGKRESNNK
ncbi:lysophospholipase [Paenibacillus sp. sptzw28]|uniref:alpha/beta hydrolase n=1 Tax=Paenibacillus sp. sptzw28 TaxID=715179 RepID=UPI001C6F3938|nr:alpha/beta hydrolase [Paenibacillus sp. sptzw28]QYR19540.1 lysophospholipase [Paenibacillus sp. sptzw28]